MAGAHCRPHTPLGELIKKAKSDSRTPTSKPGIYKFSSYALTVFPIAGTYGEPVVGPTFWPEMQVNEQSVECSILAEDLPDADRPDEWRQYHRYQHDGAEQALTEKTEAITYEGQWQSDEKR